MHGGNPVLRWMFENVYVETDAAGGMKPSKKKSREKIDGAVATIMSVYCDVIVKRFVNHMQTDEGVFLLRDGVKTAYHAVEATVKHEAQE